MKQSLFVILAIAGFIACKNHTPTNTEATQKDTSTAAKSFFPVVDFIGGEMKMVDSLQLPLTKTVTINKKEKLTQLSDAEFHMLAKNFTEPDINTSALRRFYTESSIADESIPSISFTYTATDTALPIQKVNVFVKPDPIENDKVRGIYIEKVFRNGDTAIQQKLYWKAGRNMQIITEKRIGDKHLPAEQVKVVWDPTE
jgi:hypothetical protein